MGGTATIPPPITTPANPCGSTSQAARVSLAPAWGDTLFSIENVNGSSYYDDLLIGNDGANVLAGYGGNDTLKGGGGDDYLSGFEGNDFLLGGAGADTFNAGLGMDNMSGGTGDDIYLDVEGHDTVNEAAGEGRDTVYTYASAYTLTANVETLVLARAATRLRQRQWLSQHHLRQRP